LRPGIRHRENVSVFGARSVASMHTLRASSAQQGWAWRPSTSGFSPKLQPPSAGRRGEPTNGPGRRLCAGIGEGVSKVSPCCEVQPGELFNIVGDDSSLLRRNRARSQEHRVEDAGADLQGTQGIVASASVQALCTHHPRCRPSLEAMEIVEELVVREVAVLRPRRRSPRYDEADSLHRVRN